MTIEYYPTLVIGGGYWGEKYISALGKNCVAVIDPNNDRLDQLAAMYGVWEFQSVEDLIAQGPKRGVFLDEINHIIITTPPEYHVYYAKKFSLEGKYVLVEKPFSLR